MPLVVPQSMSADDHVLRHVHQAARQVAGVRGPQRGVGHALPGAVRGDEELQHGQALVEVRLDRQVLDEVAERVGHQAAHAGELGDLLLEPRAPELVTM